MPANSTTHPPTHLVGWDSDEVVVVGRSHKHKACVVVPQPVSQAVEHAGVVDDAWSAPGVGVVDLRVGRNQRMD